MSHKEAQKAQMILVFRRTGQRRYAVEARRDGFPDLEMNPAPGYNPLIPHDMMHLVVESQLGLTHAIFGQLAAGGTAGSFQLKDSDSSRETARTRKRVRARGKRIMKNAGDECAQSERATYICWYEWLNRSPSPEKNKITKEMTEHIKQVKSNAVAALNERKIDEICKHLDHLSSHWSRLNVGESLAVAWPDLAIVTVQA